MNHSTCEPSPDVGAATFYGSGEKGVHIRPFTSLDKQVAFIYINIQTVSKYNGLTEILLNSGPDDIAQEAFSKF